MAMKCSHCHRYICNTQIHLFSCTHNYFCVQCAIKYIESDKSCEICKNILNEKMFINGIEDTLVISAKESYLIEDELTSTQTLIVDGYMLEDYIENWEETEDTLVRCALCEDEIDINWRIYHKCQCEINKTFVCGDCIYDNPEFNDEYVCDHRCLISIVQYPEKKN